MINSLWKLLLPSSQITRKKNSQISGLKFDSLEPRNMMTAVSVFAAGETGSEAFNLIINNQVVETFENVGGDTNSRQFERFEFHTDDVVNADQVQIEFINDAVFESHDRNLLIDRLVIDGQTFQTEAASTHSTGLMENDFFTGEGFFQTEELNVNGTLSYQQQSQESGTRVRIDALGETGEENLQLLIDGEIVKNFRFASADTPHKFLYTSDQVVDLSQIRIRFTNDQFDANAGIDRNLQVMSYQTVDLESGDRDIARPTDANVYSNAVFTSEDGITPGFGRGDILASNGYFEVRSNTRIRVIASGDTGQEVMEIRVGDDVVRRVQVSTAAESYFVTVQGIIDIEDVQVAFTNDFQNENTGFDRNLTVHSFQVIDVKTLDRTIARPTDVNVFSTGTFQSDDGVAPGFARGNTLNANGYFQVSNNHFVAGTNAEVGQSFQVSQTFGGDPYLIRTESASGKFIILEGNRSDDLSGETLTLFRKNGSRATEFGTNGTVRWADVADSVGVNFTRIRDIDILADGSVLVTAHRIPNQGRSLPFLLRLDASGSVDHSFGANGLLTNTPVGGVSGDVGTLISLMETDGHVTIIGNAGSSDTSIALTHLDEHGDLDPAYGNGGSLTLPVEVFAGGRTVNSRLLLGAVALADNSVFLVNKLSSRGSDPVISILKLDDIGGVDRSFGNNGVTIIDNANGVSELIGLDSQERILILVGNQIVRVNNSGGLDSSFGNNGVVDIVPIERFSRSEILVDNQDRIVIIGNRISPPVFQTRVSLVGSNVIRYTDSGILDRTLDHDGIQAFDDSTIGFTAEFDMEGNLLAGVGQTGSEPANFQLSRLKFS